MKVAVLFISRCWSGLTFHQFVPRNQKELDLCPSFYAILTKPKFSLRNLTWLQNSGVFLVRPQIWLPSCCFAPNLTDLQKFWLRNPTSVILETFNIAKRANWSKMRTLPSAVPDQTCMWESPQGNLHRKCALKSTMRRYKSATCQHTKRVSRLFTQDEAKHQGCAQLRDCLDCRGAQRWF